MSNKDTNQSAHPHSIINLSFPPEKTLAPWLPIERPSKTGRMHRLILVQWVHLPTGIFCWTLVQFIANILSLKMPVITAVNHTFCEIYLHLQGTQGFVFHVNHPTHMKSQALSFEKPRQNLKLSSAVNFCWHVKG